MEPLKFDATAEDGKDAGGSGDLSGATGDGGRVDEAKWKKPSKIRGCILGPRRCLLGIYL